MVSRLTRCMCNSNKKKFKRKKKRVFIFLSSSLSSFFFLHSLSGLPPPQSIHSKSTPVSPPKSPANQPNYNDHVHANKLLQLPHTLAASPERTSHTLRNLPGCHPHRRPPQRASPSALVSQRSASNARASNAVPLQPRASGTTAERAREEEGGDMWDIV